MKRMSGSLKRRFKTLTRLLNTACAWTAKDFAPAAVAAVHDFIQGLDVDE